MPSNFPANGSTSDAVMRLINELLWWLKDDEKDAQPNNRESYERAVFLKA